MTERVMKWLGISLIAAAMAIHASAQQLPIVLQGGGMLTLGTNVVAWIDTNSYAFLLDGTTNSAGNALDVSGNNNIGLMNSTPIWSSVTNTANQVRGYWTFEGTNAFILMTSNSLVANGDYTMGGWMYEPTTRYQGGTIMFGAGDVVGNAFVVMRGLWNDNGYHAHSVQLTSLNGWADVKNNIFNLPVTNWHQVTMVRQSGVGYLYANGQLIITGAVQNITGITQYTIGMARYGTTKYRPWRGSIYRPYIMNYAQSSNSIYDLYLNTRPR